MSLKELPVDRSLINARFESYRLTNSVRFNVTEIELAGGEELLKLKLEDEKIDTGYLHAAMVARINYLYTDWTNPDKVYAITSKGKVITSAVLDGKLSSKYLFTIPDFYDQIFASLLFPSKNLAVIVLSHERAAQFVLEALIIRRQHDASNPLDEGWTSLGLVVLFDGIAMVDQFDAARWSMSASIDSIQTNNGGIDLVVAFIAKRTKATKHRSKSEFGLRLQWFSLAPDSNNIWSKCGERFLMEDGVTTEWIRYAALTPSQQLVVVSDRRMRFIGGAAAGCSKSDNIDEMESIEEAVPSIEETADANYAGLTHEQLEECDFEDALCSLVLTSFTVDGLVLGEYDLCNQQWLFNVPNFGGGDVRSKLPALVMRYDVDAFVYCISVDDQHGVVLKHQASIDAFGYIQASKRDRHYLTLGQVDVHSEQPRWPYAIIVDSGENIFLYWKSAKDDTMDKDVVGCQYICKLPEVTKDGHQEGVLGVHCVPTLAADTDRLHIILVNRTKLQLISME